MYRDQSSFERRYSFNASMRNPIAESTNLNNTNGNRSGMGSSFKWGSSPTSPKLHRSNSSVNLINFDSTFGRDSPHHKSLRKIDPRIVADVQSKGLASRIVKYHENGSRLNRSMSAHNLCTKPGQFPVVALKKTELPYHATKQNVSMTRIAPPEKSVFYGSTLSSLLRSNSVIGLHKSDEDISRENRPILHPPPTENDMAPTRSVLDVLKEISRKRINSDDADVQETSKKNRIGNDLVDTGAQTVMTQDFRARTSFKRHRNLNFYHESAYSPPKSPDSSFSPEQAKKRVCNYNNDITSSLSSSVKRCLKANKRPSYQLNQTMPTRLEPYEIQKNKTSKYDGHISSSEQIFVDCLENTIAKPVNSYSNGPTTIVKANGNVYGSALPCHSKSVPIQIESVITIPANNKPRLTLFNKAYEVDNDSNSIEVAEEADNLNDSGDCAGIHFVKPKKLTSAGIKNPVIERAQKSKLALMLSGLRGEIYNENDIDELDAQPKQAAQNKIENKTTEEKKDKVMNLPITKTDVLPTTSTISSSVAATSLSTTSKVNDKPETTSSNTKFTLNTPSSNTSPLVGLKLSPPTSTTANSIPAQKTEATTKIGGTPVLQGFSFGSSISAAQLTATTKAPAAATATLGTPTLLGTNTQPSFAFKPVTSSSTSESDGTIKIPLNPSKNTAINFGILPKTSTTPSSLTNNFAFTPANTTALKVPTTETSSTATTSAPSASVPSTFSTSAVNTTLPKPFSFGSNATTTSAPSQNSTIVPQTVVASTSTPTYSFGTASTATANFSAPSGKPAGGFSFGNPTTNTQQNPKFSFGTAPSQNNQTPVLAFGLSNNDKTPPAYNPGTTKETSSVNASAEPNKTAFGQPTSAAALAFGTPTSAVAPAFGTTPTSAATPSFGTTPTSAAPPAFGTTPTSAATASFGTTPTSAAPPAFRTTPTSAAPPAFGTPTTIASNAFGSPSIQSQSNMFGSLAPQPQSMFGSIGPKTTFGADSTKPTSNLFSGLSATNNTSTIVPFGQPAADNSAAANKPAAATGGFSFGSTGGSFTFGASNNTTPVNNASSAPTETNKTFTFGAGAKNLEPNKPNNVFGSSASMAPTNPSAGGFSFGSVSSTSIAPTNPSTGGFSFGSGGTTSIAPVKPLTSGFTFGSGAGTAPVPKPVEPSASNFSFGGSGTATAAVTKPSTFTFGAANAQSNTSIPSGAGGFQFGAGLQQKTNDTTTNKPFSFGSPIASNNNALGSTNNTAVPSNMFASSMMNKPAAPAFNFGATATATPQATVAPTANTNIFAPTMGTPASSDRPIRRATRRLQK